MRTVPVAFPRDGGAVAQARTGNGPLPRVGVVVDEVVAVDDLELRADAAAQGVEVVVDPGVEDGHRDAAAADLSAGAVGPIPHLRRTDQGDAGVSAGAHRLVRVDRSDARQ